MGKNTSFSLGERFERFIDRKVDEGRYSTASDVVRAALRLLEEHELKVKEAALIAALIEGEESGPATSFDFKEFIAQKKREWADLKGELPSDARRTSGPE